MRPLLARLRFVSSPLAAGDFTLSPQIGTLGYGAGVGFRIARIAGVRLIGNSGSYSRNLHKENIKYSGTLHLQNFGGLVDLYPTGGRFRLTGGALSNRDHISLISDPTNVITIDGVQYSSAIVGYVTGDVTFKRIAPYIGLGWGAASGSRWSLTLDAGAIQQGSPKFSVTPHPTIPQLVPASFYVDLERERAKTENDLRNYRWYPVVTIGVAWSF
jgi:hypothetical protein